MQHNLGWLEIPTIPKDRKGEKKPEKNEQQFFGKTPATGKIAGDRSHSPATTESRGEPEPLSGEVQKPPLTHRTLKNTNTPSKSHQLPETQSPSDFR